MHSSHDLNVSNNIVDGLVVVRPMTLNGQLGFSDHIEINLLDQVPPV